MKKLCIISFLFIILSPAYSIHEIDLKPSESQPSIRLIHKGQWFYDSDCTWSFNEISLLKYADFNNHPPVNFGFKKNALWLAYDFKVHKSGTYVLYSNWHKAKKIRVFQKSGNNTIKQVDSRIDLRKPSFELFLPDGDTTIYVEITSSAPIIADLYISDISSFVNKVYPEEIFMAFYFGVIAVIALYNLFVFFSSKDINYLYYFMYLFFLFMYQLAVEGYGKQFLWSGADWFALRSYNVFISCTFTVGVIFTSSYLELKTRHQLLFNIGRVLKYLFILTGILYLIFFESWLMPLGNFCIISGIIYFMTCGIVLFRKGFKPARFFISAWSFLMIGAFITTAKRLHWLPYNLFTEYALHLGSMAETVLLALALGDKVQYIQNKKLEAEEALIEANREIMQDRMRPHFLFNSMNIIFNQLRDNPEAAQNTLQSLSDNYHYLTETKGKKILPFFKEWQFLENYLSLMQQRWPDELFLILECDDALHPLPFPPLSLQPLAENAFKYALRHLKIKSLTIRAEIIDAKVSISFKHPAYTPLGEIDYSRSLGNIKNRLNKYYPDIELLLFQEADDIITLLTFAYPGD